jgi:hypothetical protein
LKHRFRGGAACLVIDNQDTIESRIVLLDLFIDGQVLIFSVVDLDIKLVAHISSGSYREETETPKKE